MRAAHPSALALCLGLWLAGLALGQVGTEPPSVPDVAVEHLEDVTFPCIGPGPDAAGLQPCIDIPLRDVCVCRGHDGWYYLTGTTGQPDWKTRNEGIWVWRSRDLQSWERIGKVWDIEQEGSWQKEEKPLANGKTGRAVWAPEIHYFRETYWISYAMNWGGTGLLKSSSGMIAGPYEDMGRMTSEGRDASLFVDDDGRAYWVYQDGRVARMKEDLSGLAEPPRLLTPAVFESAGRRDANAARAERRVGAYGAFMAKRDGKYLLFCSERFRRMDAANDDVFVAVADRIDGPYSARSLVLPHGGQSMLFRGPNASLWMTFSGDGGGFAAFVDQPGLVPMEWMAARALLRPSPSVILERGPVAHLRPVADLALDECHVLADPAGLYQLVGTTPERGGAGEIQLWQSQDLIEWRSLGTIWSVTRDGTWSKTPPAEGPGSRSPRLRGPEIHALRGSYWLPFSMTWGAMGLLKSVTGTASGPYIDVGPAPLGAGGRDLSLFGDDDGQVYALFDGGMLAPMKEDLTGFAKDPVPLLDTEGQPLGDGGAFMVKIAGHYCLGASRWQGDEGVDGSYDLVVGIADQITGPFHDRHVAVPHGGGGSFFRAHAGGWYCAFVGGDRSAPFRSRLGVLRLDVEPVEGGLRIAPAADAPPVDDVPAEQ